MGWKLREVIVAAVLSIVCGAIYLAWDFIFQSVSFASPVVQATLNGLWWMASCLVAYIVRRPGAAFIAEVVGCFAEFAFGSPYGIQGVLIGVFQGIGSEIPFLATKYNRWGTTTLILSGAMGGIGNTIFSYFWYGVKNYTLSMQIGYLIATMLSGVILAGLFPKWIGNALKRANVLQNFRISAKG
jgi:energy-coupling factor transport system permease protein